MKSLTTPSDPLMVEYVRGGIVESEHRVSVSVRDVDGRELLACGDTARHFYLRSSAKPFQALPYVEMVAERAELDDRQLALACASHSGTDLHAQLVLQMLTTIHLDEASLLCGVHTPFDRATAEALLKRAEAPSPLRHNCSGKHAAMLQLATLLDEEATTYLEPASGVQIAILSAFCALVSEPEDRVVIGTDGCSAPNFAVPLPAAALGYARLMDPSVLEPQRAAACRMIVEAMTGHPVLVGGEGRFDTSLMRAASGVLCKGGAEGYRAVGLPAGRLPGHPAVGVALKVHDGDHSKRAAGLVILAILESLGALDREVALAMADFSRRPITNFRNLPVGELRLAEESQERLAAAHAGL